MTYWPHSNPELQPAGDDAGWRCALRCTDRDGQAREPLAPSLLCGACYARLRRHTRELGEIHTWLGTEMIRVSHGWSEPVSGSPNRVAPLVLELHDLRTDLVAVVRSWTRMVAEQHQPPMAGPRNPELGTVLDWLVQRLGWMCEQPWISDYAGEVSDLHIACHTARPWTRHRRDMPAPCPGCKLLSLSLYGGDDGVVCRNPLCPVVIPEQQYEFYVRVLADEHRIAVPEAV
jgi:hypothetical protein